MSGETRRCAHGSLHGLRRMPADLSVGVICLLASSSTTKTTLETNPLTYRNDSAIRSRRSPGRDWLPEVPFALTRAHLVASTSLTVTDPDARGS